jgi:TetR/AcrR family acrAB operon transcriptional repressor
VSKEALFRAVIERLHESALAAEIAAANAAEKAGGSLADILVAGVTTRLRQFIASFDGSPHIEELFSEHLTQARDLYQKYATPLTARRRSSGSAASSGSPSPTA